MLQIDKKKCFVELGKFLSQFSFDKNTKNDSVLNNDLFYTDFIDLINLSQSHNGWFTQEQVYFAVQSWANALKESNLKFPVGFYYEGKTLIAKPGECCTESFIVLGAFKTEKEVLAYKSYIFTKTVRFLLLQTVVSQHVTKNNFQFIPDLIKYEGVYTDEMLRKKWEINEEEWQYIDTKIKATELMGNRKNEDNE